MEVCNFHSTGATDWYVPNFAPNRQQSMKKNFEKQKILLASSFASVRCSWTVGLMLAVQLGPPPCLLEPTQ